MATSSAATSSSTSAPPPLPLPLQLVLAGASNACGCLATHPIDTWKVSVQLRGQSHGSAPGGAAGALAALRAVVSPATGGVAALYRGLVPALARESTYSAIRVGLYEPARGVAVRSSGSDGLAARLLAGGATGALAAALTTPLDLLKSRSQSGAPAAARSLRAIAAAEGGAAALWRGVGANVQRAAAVTAAQLATYDTCKRALARRASLREGFALHVAASLLAGAAASAVVAPLDLAKSRIMAAAGAPPPTVAAVLAAASRREGGARALTRGFTLAWLRLGPHTIISFVVYEQMRALAGMRPL